MGSQYVANSCLFVQFTQTDMAQLTWLDLNKNMLLLLHVTFAQS